MPEAEVVKDSVESKLKVANGLRVKIHSELHRKTAYYQVASMTDNSSNAWKRQKFYQQLILEAVRWQIWRYDDKKS